jgi:hypothetical protein
MRIPALKLGLACVALLLCACLLSPAAEASFGLDRFDVTFTEADGSTDVRAGSHPFAMTTTLHLNTRTDPAFGTIPEEEIKDLGIQLPTGFVGSPRGTPRCSTADFLTAEGGDSKTSRSSTCPDNTAVGVTAVTAVGSTNAYEAPVFNLVPPPGVTAKLGFVVLSEPVTIEVGVNPDSPHNVTINLSGITQSVNFFGAKVEIWGNPGDPAHDALRGRCVSIYDFATPNFVSRGVCSTNQSEAPFLTLPRTCTGPLLTTYTARSWQGSLVEGSSTSHDASVPPNPLGLFGCGKLGFQPTIEAKPTTLAANSPTGLDFSLNVHDEGLTNPLGLASSDIGKTEVTLPEGFTVNPSIAAGLNVCTEADLARESAFSAAGAGCPNGSKIGTVEVESQLLDESLDGAVYAAAPYENPFDSLIALYVVIKNPISGIIVKQPLKVEPDPLTGRIRTVAEDMPQLPFSHFKLHFREGARSPLASPPGCGTYNAEATLYPWSGGAPVTTGSAFQIITGPAAGPCPAGGLPPFKPGLIAGTLNNAAGHYSPFDLRLFRSDSEQEFTHFSIKLPPGVVAKLAGTSFCGDRQIAAAKAREGQPHGGREELEGPSCPATSEIGRTLVGAGVGPSLTYVPGRLYLAGPYHGSAISIVAITSGLAGPFDLGSVVVREALRIDPETAEVFIDATGSDPIPHIIRGIPVHLRDIRVYTDRPEFVLNPTSCKPTSTASTVLGSGLDFGSEADDNPITVTTRFQAADCAGLGFKPRLSLRLRGGTKRGANPALRAVLRPRAGDANPTRVSVALPHSEFLDQGHIRTVCTRVQFKAGAGNGSECPEGAVYGHARAWTPLLDQPLEGPIFLRSSEHPLPDLVLALHGLIEVDAVGRIDSVDGGIRNTFDFVPDAPISKVVVNLEGGRKGLLENSTDICRGRHRAQVKMKGHNGKLRDFATKMKARCGGSSHRHARR